MTAFGDHLGKLKAFAAKMGLPFECYDSLTPDELEAGRRI